MKTSFDPIDYHTKQSEIIEKTLDAFGIRARICEINDEGDSYRYSLEIVMGTRIDDILVLDKDLSLALATVKPVKIIGQEPGRSVISIIVPKTKNSPKAKDKQSAKAIPKQEVITKYVTFDNVERFRRVIALVLVIVSNGLIWIARRVDSEHDIEWQDEGARNMSFTNETEIPVQSEAKPIDLRTLNVNAILTHLLILGLAFASVARIGWLIYLDLSFGDSLSAVFFFIYVMTPAVLTTYFMHKLFRRDFVNIENASINKPVEKQSSQDEARWDV